VLGTVEVSNIGIGITVVDCNLMAEKGAETNNRAYYLELRLKRNNTRPWCKQSDCTSAISWPYNLFINGNAVKFVYNS
jgi:hypothetical protein